MLSKIKIWSVLTESAWSSLEQNGELFTDSSLIDEDYKQCYGWMVEQLTQHVGPPPDEVTYPLWAWVQYQSAHKPKPDLRHSAFGKRGDKAVLIEMNVSRNQLLQSDFDLWHYVINNGYVPESEVDAERFEAFTERGALSAQIQDEKRKSWNRIFDLDWADPYIAPPKEQKRIQAVMWQFSLKDVARVKHFVTR